MDGKKMLESDYLDILFNGRNKAYGGYQLRKSYPARIRRAGMFLAAVALASITYTVMADKLESRRVTALPLPQTDTTIFAAAPPPDKPKPMPKVQPAAAAPVKTAAYTPPKIVADDKVEKHLATQEELQHAVAGRMTIDADSFSNESPDIIDPKAKKGGSGYTASVEPGGGKVPGGNTIVDFVDQPAEFPGGEKALHEYLSGHIEYPAKAYAASKEGKVRIKFVVNEDGTITQVQATRGFGFGSEEEAVRVVAGMPKWKPGKLNGVAVKSWFFLPVTFTMAQ